MEAPALPVDSQRQSQDRGEPYSRCVGAAPRSALWIIGAAFLLVGCGQPASSVPTLITVDPKTLTLQSSDFPGSTSPDPLPESADFLFASGIQFTGPKPTDGFAETVDLEPPSGAYALDMIISAVAIYASVDAASAVRIPPAFAKNETAMTRQIGDAAQEEFVVTAAATAVASVHGLIWRYRNVIAYLFWSIGASGLTGTDLAYAYPEFWTMAERMQTYMRLAGG